MNKIKLILVTIFLLSVSFSVMADNYIKREFRAVWLTTVWALDWPTTTGTGSSVATTQKNELTGYLDQFKNDGFQVVFFQVRSMCDAMYNSKYEPWSSFLTGSRGSAPSWDPLAFCIEECHKRGLECHAWVNPYRWSTGTQWSSTQDQQLQNNGWLISYSNSDGNITILNPGLAAARQRIIDVCEDIISNYDVDGLVFDDYFYPNSIPETSSADDYSTYKNSGTKLSYGDWRRNNINLMVKGVWDMVQSTKPWVRFGISPAGAACSNSSVAAKHGVEPLSNYCSANDWQYAQIYSDPVQWLEDGTIDYISPQLYWITTHSTNPFGPMTKWWSIVAKQFGRHHYASHSLSFLTSNTTSNWAEVAKQIQYSRDYTVDNCPGAVMYNTRPITGKGGYGTGVGEYLYENKFQAKALPPAMTWKTASDPGKVQNFTKSGTTLSWSSLGDNVRYTVYAIPTYISKESAQATIASGIDANYLLGISYSTSFTLSTGIADESSYYYAVCPFDRYGNEYEPTYSDENYEPATKVTLKSPINSAVVSSPATFKWSAVSGATYKLQISKSNDFTNVAITKTGLTTNSASVDILSLGESATCYWRVITSETGKVDTSSDVATFKTAEFPSITGLSLTSPANNSTVADGQNVSFSWAAVTGASYKFELAKDASFSNLVKSLDLTSNSTSVAMSELTYSTKYYWRVTATKTGYKTSTTSTWNFTTPTLDPAPSVTLVSPASGTVINSDFILKFTSANVDSYKVELSRSSDFITIAKTINVTPTSGSTQQCSVSVSDLASGTYYWRVTTIKSGYMPTTSTAWSLILDIYGNEDGYTVKKDPAAYTVPTLYQFENLWIRSVDSDFDNIPARTDYNFNRGMCVIDGIIYLVGRETNNSTSDCYIDRYNAATGEYIGQLTLSSDVKAYYFPCNDVLKDDAGNLLTSNLTINITSGPLVIHKINKNTGDATLVASLSYTSAVRIDHCAVKGDVESGNFYVLAGTKGDTVIKWTYSAGKLASTKTMQYGELYPSSASEPGLSVRVYPKDDNTFFSNATMIHPTLYDFTSGDIVSSFEKNTENEPLYEYANGFAHFTINNVNYMVYSYNTVYTEDAYNFIGGPHQFRIATVGSDYNFSSVAPLVTFPEGGLGNEYSFYGDELIDYEYEYTADGDVCGANIYFYIPANGLAAYKLVDNRATTLAMEFNSDKFAVTLGENALFANAPADVEIYTVSGIKVAAEKGITRVSTAGLVKGVYLAKFKSEIGTKIIKFVK